VEATARVPARRFLLAGLAALLFARPFQAAAASYTVTPIQVFLGSSNTSALLTIENKSTETLRFQVTANSWSQSPKGEVELGPTEDVVFFPALLSVEPGKQRKIRVGVAKPAAGIEKTYRIFVEELPPLEKPAQPGNRSEVKVLTRMGIPIFVRPAKIRREGAVESPKLDGGELTFRVRNAGNIAFTLLSVRVSGTGADGATTFEKQADGWYVLAGGVREYGIPLPPADCVRTKTLAIEARTEQETFKASLGVTPESCAPVPR
jgi:fimbrial chaperone protein